MLPLLRQAVIYLLKPGNDVAGEEHVKLFLGKVRGRGECNPDKLVDSIDLDIE